MKPDRPDDLLARLSDHLDCERPADEQAEFEAALAADPALRAEFDALVRVDRLVRASATPPPELDWDAFTRDARAQREATKAVPAQRRRPWRRAWAVAAAVAMLATAGLLWNAWPGADSAETSVATVTLSRVRVTPNSESVATASVVRGPQTASAAMRMGPPVAPRTLIVAVASRPQRNDNASDEDAGYF